MLIIPFYVVGYPEYLAFSEFRRRFDILLPRNERQQEPVLDEKQVVFIFRSLLTRYLKHLCLKYILKKSGKFRLFSGKISCAVFLPNSEKYERFLHIECVIY